MQVCKLSTKALKSKLRKLKNALERTHAEPGMATRLMRAQVSSGKLPPEALPLINEMMLVRRKREWKMKPGTVAFHLSRIS